MASERRGGVGRAVALLALALAAAACGDLEDGALEHALAGRPTGPTPAVAPGTFVSIPAGLFTMGSPVHEAGRGSDETEHEVVLTRAFELQATEVTQGEWSELMGWNPSEFDSCGDDCPVEYVTWYDALAYCNALSQARGLAKCYSLAGCELLAGPSYRENMTCDSVTFVGLDCAGYRLPTEAEWEYAYRAGTTTAWHHGDDEANVGTIAWYHGNSGDETWPVATRAPNPWGLYDMAGNVWEWCWDEYGDYPTDAVTDPQGEDGGSYRVYRGGSWRNDARVVRAAFRSQNVPGLRNDLLGFRPARSILP